MATDNRLDIPIGVDLTGLRDGLAQAKRDVAFFSGSLQAALTHSTKLNLSQSQLANQLNAIAKMSDSGLSRMFIAGAEGIAAIDLDTLRNDTQQTVAAMTAAWELQQAAIGRTVANIQTLNDSITQPAAMEAIDRLQSGFRAAGAAASDLKLPQLDVPKLTYNADVQLEPVELPRLNYEADVDLPQITPPPLTISPAVDLPELDLPRLNYPADVDLPALDTLTVDVQANVQRPQLDPLNVVVNPDVIRPTIEPQRLTYKADIDLPQIAPPKLTLRPDFEIKDVTIRPDVELPDIEAPAVTIRPIVRLPDIKTPQLDYDANVNLNVPDVSDSLRGITDFADHAISIRDAAADTRRHMQSAAAVNLPDPPDVPQNKPPVPTPARSATAGNIAMVASAAIASTAYKGVTMALGKAAVAAGHVQTATNALSKTVTDVRGNFDLFRAAKFAPDDVDETMNSSARILRQSAETNAARIEHHRRMVDAEQTGWKATAAAAAKSADIVSQANQRAAQSMSKHEWANRNAAGSAKFLSAVYAPVGGVVRETANAFRTADPDILATAATLRQAAEESEQAAVKLAAKAYVVSGALDEGSGAAQRFGHVIKAASLPSRLMFRELEGGSRVINRTMSVVSAITKPLRAMQDYSAQNRQEWAMLKTLLGESDEPKGPGVLRRAFGATAAASKVMADAVAGSSRSVITAVAGTSVVQRELEFQKRRFAELKSEFREFASPLTTAVSTMRQRLSEFSGDLYGRVSDSVAVVQGHLSRLAASAPVQRLFSASATAAKAFGSSVAWAGPKLKALASGLVSGTVSLAKWTQSQDFGKRATAALAKTNLFLYQKTRLLHPVFGLATRAVRGAFRAIGLGKPAATNTAKATATLAREAQTAATSTEHLATSANHVKQSLSEVTPVAKQAGKAIQASSSAGSGRGFKSFIGGAIASKLAVGALIAAMGTWGASNAIATETATVKFGTLLQDMDQGKALIAEITDFSAVTPFANDELRESAGLLLAAQVPANAITDRLQMLGDIAAGTSQPISDITKIFQKMASTGKVSQESLNQLAERGVPIYGALQQQLGKSRKEMLDMISKGEVGFADMDAALQSLTAGTGVFAGGMAAQSQTVAGLWSTLRDNVGIAFETVMSVLVEGMKPLMTFGIQIAQTVTGVLKQLQPVVNTSFEMTKSLFVGLYSVVKQSFTLIGGIVSSVFAAMGIAGGGTFTDLVEGLITMFALAKYTFQNFPLAAAIAWDATLLGFVRMGNNIAHWFTTTVPTYLNWFGDNFTRLFIDLGSFVGTVFTNLGSNIKSIMTAIWDFIASGGTGALDMAWTPLTEGFRKTIDDLPEIPERAITQLEVQMQSDIDGMKTEFGAGVGEAVAEALATMSPPEKVELKSTTGLDTRIEEDSVDADKDRKTTGRTSFIVDSLDRGSEAALKAIFANQGGSKTADKQLSEQKHGNKLLGEIKTVLKSSPTPELIPGV